jgi:hypothetical protein
MEDSMKKMDYTLGLEAGRAGQKWNGNGLARKSGGRNP